MESARKEAHELGIGELPTLGYADLEGIIDNAVFLSQTHLHAVLGGSVQEALMVISGQMWGPGKTFGWVGECVCGGGDDHRSRRPNSEAGPGDAELVRTELL